MFPDSKIAQKFGSSRTKTTQIVKRAVASELHAEVVEKCRTSPFSLSIDESNDKNCEKNLAILVRYFNEQSTTRFLAMPVCNIVTTYRRSSWRVKRIDQLLQSHEMKLYFMFLAHALEPLNEFNTLFLTLFQPPWRDKNRLLRTFLGRFVKKAEIRATEEDTDLTKVWYAEADSQHPDHIVTVGKAIRTYLYDNRDDIPPATVSKFFRSVKTFYQTVVAKMIAKFPFEDPVISNLGFLNPARRGGIHPPVCSLARRFPALVPEEELDTLEKEYTDYSVTPAKEMPAYQDIRVDDYWGRVGGMKNRITNTQRFPRLCRLAQALLTIPNSNADCEQGACPQTPLALMDPLFLPFDKKAVTCLAVCCFHAASECC
ncbi:hypothetical protein ScPMuIL_009258 [Solemya velum]